MAPVAVAGPAYRHPRLRALGSGAARRLVGAVLTGALVAGLLVGPVLCWSSSAQAIARSDVVDVVPRVLREDVAAALPVRVVDVPAVQGGVAAVAAAATASVGAVVLDPQGRSLLETSDADRPVSSASLVKLLVVQQLLARAGPAGWDAATARRLERAITVSDDGAMNVLWTTYDGPALVRAAVAQFGLTATAPPAEAGQWGQATTSASDVARFLSALAATPGATDAATLLTWMRQAAPTGADGFDQTFGLLSGAGGAGVAAKQGWMCCVDGRRQLHSAGVLDDGRVVVVLAEASAARPWDVVGDVVDRATTVLVEGTR
ncbi:serine hydrolase [Modestobacter versicolor]|uniref:serine hydrolase n=1 Tax=Modestobacter versicolor TaxID=429133 RepID=UPI0034DEC880